jgi:dipeptidyl aminopeptidase/acylaminoacyl peptidase
MKTIVMMAALTLLFSAPVLGVSAEPLTLQNLRSMVSVSDARISPDGKNVAFIASVGDYTHDLNNKRLMIVSAAGGAPTALTNVTKGLANVQWSPSGDRLAFIANDKRNTAQVYTVAPNGGARTQVTHAKKDVEQFAWSPNGTLIAYVAEDTPRDAAAFSRHEDLWEVHDDGFLTTYAPQPSHLWIAQANGGSDRRLTSGSWSVLEAAPPFAGMATDPSWSADGKSIAFTMQSDADDSDSDRTSVAMVDVATGAVTKLDKRTQYEYQPFYANSGRDIAYVFPHGPGPSSVFDVYVGNVTSNTDITPHLNRDVAFAQWLPDKRLLLRVADGPQSAFYVQGLTGAATRLALGDLNPSQSTVAKTGAIAFVASATNKPSEVYLLTSVNAMPKQLTNLNAKLAALDYGKSKEITWTAPDGQRSDGILTYPVDYTPGKKYPLVLRIHGGPQASTSLSFETLRQLFAGRGYLVFQPNYRGSDNLGSAHEHAIVQDPGIGPGNDVMAGVAAVEKMGIVDTSREAVTGHSYGGYMTTWLITHWHNWRSAVVGDGMVDWNQEYNLSATGNLAWARDSLGGSPWDPKVASLYRSGSPITYVRQITTPTLIISGTADEQVPVSESYELYHALHDQGVTVEFIALPTSKHGPTDPAHIEGYNRITLDWVDKYMK